MHMKIKFHLTSPTHLTQPTQNQAAQQVNN
jgi:hypothetical protein